MFGLEDEWLAGAYWVCSGHTRRCRRVTYFGAIRSLIASWRAAQMGVFPSGDLALSGDSCGRGAMPPARRSVLLRSTCAHCL